MLYSHVPRQELSALINIPYDERIPQSVPPFQLLTNLTGLAMNPPYAKVLSNGVTKKGRPLN